MAHLTLHLHLRQFPHVKRMRARAPRRLAVIRPNHKTELWYRSELLSLVRHCQTATQDEVLKALRPHWPVVRDAVPGLGDALNRAARRFGNLKVQANKLASLAVRKAKGDVDKRLAREIQRSVSVDISSVLTDHGRVSDVMRGALQWNVQLIQSIPEEYLGKVGAAVSEAWSQGRRWEDLVDLIADEGEVAESRAKVIARDQISKMNAGFNRAQQLDLGIRRYTWRTAGDERTRETHLALDNQTFSWDEEGPLEGTIDGAPCHPGEDILCRCGAEPYFNLDELEAAA